MQAHITTSGVRRCFHIENEDEGIDLFMRTCGRHEKLFADIIDEMADKGGGGALPFSRNKVKCVCKDEKGWSYEASNGVRITLRIG